MTGIELGTLLTIGSLAATAVSAVGSIVQGNSQASAAETNARLMEQQAEQSRLTAAEDETRIRRDNARRMGTAAANRGAAGVAMEGSPLDVFADAAAEGELAALDARYSGLMQSRQYQNQAALDREQARSLRSGGFWNAAGTLIGGGLQYGRSLLGGGRTLGGGMTRTGYTSGVQGGYGRLVGGV